MLCGVINIYLSTRQNDKKRKPKQLDAGNSLESMKLKNSSLGKEQKTWQWFREFLMI